MNLEDVGVERQPVQCGDLCKIEIYCEIKSPLVNRSLAKPSRWVAEGFANIANRKFDAAIEPGIFQKTERFVR